MPFRLAIGLRTAFANLRTKPNAANHLTWPVHLMGHLPCHELFC